MTHRLALSCNINAALHWFDFGLQVIPITPGKKCSTVKWDNWLNGLSPEAIYRYWTDHPDHEVGCIVGDDLIVFDADSPAAIAALAELEKTFGMSPSLTVNTAKGKHHFFKRAPDTYAKSDSHSTEKHPERIDVKTGRALVVLPPSTGKEVDIDEAENVAELTVANQEFIDAVFIHNGKDAPRPPVVKTSSPLPLPADMDQATTQLNAMLQHIDSDCGYDDWLHVLMAAYNETGGSDDGLALVDNWSSKGAKYGGEDEIRAKWDSFKDYSGTPVTVGTIHKILADRGINWIDVCDALEPQFERSETETIVVLCDSEQASEVISQHEHPDIPPAGPEHPLARYSLKGKLRQLEQEAVDQVLILGDLALMGQITVFYAAPNTGKTLLTLSLLIAAIKSGSLNPSKVYYINVDDSLSGVITKLRLAEECGFHMVAEGHSDFRADDLLGILTDLINTGQCKGVVIILDTLKKFTDIMSKRDSTAFSKTIRQFVMLGGTCIALAHVNKSPDRDGRPVYAGTSDILEDVDCAYTLQVISDADTHEKVVEFNNIKRRGDVCHKAAYSYSTEKGITYSDLLRSIRSVEDAELVTLQQAVEINADAEVVAAITHCIQDGAYTKLGLAEAAAKKAGVSKRATLRVINKYTGTDPAAHEWTFDVGKRGAKVYRMLDLDDSPDSPEESENQAA